MRIRSDLKERKKNGGWDEQSQNRNRSDRSCIEKETTVIEYKTIECDHVKAPVPGPDLSAALM